jgi:hypothetical protein
MATKIFRSIRAFAAALFVVFALSHGTDLLLRATGLPVMNLNDASAPLVVAIILYRNAYNVAGGYIAAWLAPAHPVRHAMVLGTLGLLGSLAATIATWNMNLGPAWYSLSIVALSLPSAWAGARLRLRVASASAKRPFPSGLYGV